MTRHHRSLESPATAICRDAVSETGEEIPREPAARPPPLRFSIVMPNNLKESFAPAQDNPGATPDKPLGDAGPTSETGCGGGEGGMTSSFTWLDSVNSTMDEVKTLIVNQQARRRGLRGAARRGSSLLLRGNSCGAGARKAEHG
eukprot:jgi/Undpi1/13404/HiC_scaffold_8.g03063.m1